MSTVPIGQTLGQYRIVEELGAGGMGVVYKAQDIRLGRLVALKVLPQSTAQDDESVDRFRREARTASSLNHANICTIYNFDEHEGQLFLAMELLEGEPLDRKLSGRPFDLKTILELGTQVADALECAHSEGVLHRDIKPANIFLTRRGQIKVLDFGLAKLAPGYGRKRHAHDAHPTAHFSSMAGTTVGTIAYMSPEQARGEDLDPRTDLFSFGVVLYEMATGRQGFPGATTAVIFDGILNREPLRPSTLNAAVPTELDRIISKALEKERALRYQTAADMRADLQRLLRDSSSRRVTLPEGFGEESSATVVMPSGSRATSQVSDSVAGIDAATSAAVPPPPPVTPHSTRIVVPAPPMWTSPKMLVGAVAALMIGMAVAAVVRSRPEPVNESASTPTGAPPVSASAEPGASPPSAAPSSAAPPSVGPGATGAVAPTPPPAANTTASSAASKPPPGTPRPARASAAAAERLAVARAKIANNLLEPALGDLRQVQGDFPGTAAAADAAFLSAEVHEKLGRIDEAMAAHVEFSQRFANDRRAAVSKLRLAELTARSPHPNRESATRDRLHDVITNYPRTPQALQALQMKIRIENARRQRELDPVLGVQVPPVIPTLRTLTEQFPTSPFSMTAFNRLANVYTDIGQFERAAGALVALGTNFPDNPHDAWFRLGELYERRLKDPARARDAYSRVPERSSRYRDAQKKLKRR